MKSLITGLCLLLAVGFISLPVESQAQMGPGMMGRGGYGGYGCGQEGWYGGGQGGYGMGPGMMGPGYGSPYGPQYGRQYGPQYGPRYQEPQRPLDKDEARQRVEDYLRSTRNPNLKIGEIEDKGTYFEAKIVTKNNDLVNEILVDKNTGWMRSAY